MENNNKAIKDYEKNQLQYDWLSCRVADETSQVVLANIIEYRISSETSFINNAYEESQKNDVCRDSGIEGQDGSGVEMILSSKYEIKQTFPGLAIDVSRIISDIWTIPRLLNMIHPEYRFFIRLKREVGMMKTVLYAFPPEEEKKGKPSYTGPKRVVTPNGLRDWDNTDLLKDCGLIPYLLHKNHGCKVTMLGVSKDDTFSNLKYVEGLELLPLADSTLAAKEEYVEQHAEEIDCLLLYGAYPTYYHMTEIYKAKNPYGKIYLALDANAHWMDRILWREADFSNFLDRCDVIAASGHTMQKHLMEKWRWPITYIPNGFYNFTDKDWEPDYEQKENVILTVARLGIPEKCTDMLLESFALVADEIPDWTMRLVGSMATEFMPYLQNFQERHPELRERIIFTGPILNREELYQEYLRAKIFALPSCSEGMPNVIGEALMMGNATAVTKWGEYPDAIDEGRCGMAADIGDVNGFAEILRCLCHSEQLEQMCQHACEYAKKNFDMTHYVAQLYDMLFLEEES